jgi:hypothetical protein
VPQKPERRFMKPAIEFVPVVEAMGRSKPTRQRALYADR